MPWIKTVRFPFISVLNFFFFLNHDLQNASCILIPGGFGDRGVRGMILAAKYARENNIPYLGICLGMQIAVIEFARSVSDFTLNVLSYVIIFLDMMYPMTICPLTNNYFRFWVWKGRIAMSLIQIHLILL